MADEIERKYIVRKCPDLEGLKSKHIFQTYIGDQFTRVRKIGDKYIYNHKEGTGLVRKEVEYQISKQKYEELLKNKIGETIEKTRYYLPLNEYKGNLIAEIDIYHGALEGLQVVEVEFESVKQSTIFACQPPEWFGKEVTGNKAFSNASLALNGMPAKHGQKIENDNDNNLYRIIDVNFDDHTETMNVTGNEGTACLKLFPVFNGKIFKPLSKQKPFINDFFAVSEVACAKIADLLKIDHASYCLARCKGLSQKIDKYFDKGTLTDNFLKQDEKFVSFLDYFEENIDDNVNFSSFINFANAAYSFDDIFNSKIFIDNPKFGEDLIERLLFKSLISDCNAHFGNLGFIKSLNNSLKIAPVFDNEYSSIFFDIYDKEKSESHLKKFNNLPNMKNRIAFAKANYPKLFENFAQKIVTLKDKHDLKEVFDLKPLKPFITNFATNREEQPDHLELDRLGQQAYQNLIININDITK